MYRVGASLLGQGVGVAVDYHAAWMVRPRPTMWRTRTATTSSLSILRRSLLRHVEAVVLERKEQLLINKTCEEL